MPPWLFVIIAYFVGSLPIGLMIARWWKGIDIRDHGSGNIGSTNVFRVVGKTAGTVVFVLDVIKGLWAPLVAQRLGFDVWWQVGAGLAGVMGHNFSPFLGFKGGKGIATSLGVLLGISWKVGLAAWALWAVLVVGTGYVSVGSIAASVSLPIFTWIFYANNGLAPRLCFATAAGLFSVYRHRANIVRLRNGTENRFRQEKKES